MAILIMRVMTETATVTSKSMFDIPASKRKKYGIKEASKSSSLRPIKDLYFCAFRP